MEGWHLKMSWLEDIKADALQLAAPDFWLEPGDEIHVNVRANDGYAYSSYTFEPATFGVHVEVWRPTDHVLTERGPEGQMIFRQTDTGQHYYDVVNRYYAGEEAADFFTALMEMGSER